MNAAANRPQPIAGSTPRDFWVWVDPSDWLTRDQITEVGSFMSVLPAHSTNPLMFVRNPDFKGVIAVFQNNLLRNYVAEYNLELSRQTYCAQFPSRLHAIFLFESAEEAEHYHERHRWHVGSRMLKKVKTVGPFCYSTHDSSWIDFLRICQTIDPQTVGRVTLAYWSRVKVQDVQLEAMGRPWTQAPIMEVLFLGKIEFYDRNLDVP